MKWARTAFGLTLALCFLSLTVSAMVARGAMAADGQICVVTGGDRVVIAADGLPLIDADGEPVMLDAPICPDCLLKTVALTADADPVAAPMRLGFALTPDRVADIRTTLRVMGGHGRGPPAWA